MVNGLQLTGHGSQFRTLKCLFFLFLGICLAFFPAVSRAKLETAVEAKTSTGEAISGKEQSWLVLQKEAYYHFFLGDYLTAATRLKLLEDSEASLNNPEVLSETRLLLGSLYLVWGMHRPAAEIFGELVSTFPPGEKRSRLLLVVQKMQYDQTFYLSAIKTYQLLSSEEGFAEMDQAAYFAGMSHIAIGALKEGSKVLRTIAPESPYFPYAQMSLAKAHLAMNERNQSIFILQSLSRRDLNAESSAEASGLASGAEQDEVAEIFVEKSQLTLGQVLIEAGRFSAARAALSQIPSHSPFYPDALFAIAWTHFKEKNELKSIVFFQDLIEKAPNHPYALEALSTVGHAYNRLEAYRKALDHYEEALKLYREKEKALQLLKRVIQDQQQLGILVDLYLTTGEGALADLIDTDRITSWIDQYGELGALSVMLDKKLADMAVFEVIAFHREEVFQAFLPSVNHSRNADRFIELSTKGRVLSKQLEEDIQEERLPALATPDEERRLQLLSEALARSRALGAQIKTLKTKGMHDAALNVSWKTVNRNLEIVEGTLVWKIITEVPGRADDLRRGMKNFMKQLQNMSEQNTKLVETVPALSQKMKAFRKRIADAQTRLIADKKESHVLQVAILKSLQHMLTERLERRLLQVDDLIATSELSRIQILDLQSGVSLQ